jgi:hypothetical protein
LAKLRAKTLRPAHGAHSAFPGSTQTISASLLAHSLKMQSVKILSVPQRKHSLGLGAAAARFHFAQATGQKKGKHL